MQSLNDWLDSLQKTLKGLPSLSHYSHVCLGPTPQSTHTHIHTEYDRRVTMGRLKKHHRPLQPLLWPCYHSSLMASISMFATPTGMRQPAMHLRCWLQQSIKPVWHGELQHTPACEAAQVETEYTAQP